MTDEPEQEEQVKKKNGRMLIVAGIVLVGFIAIALMIMGREEIVEENTACCETICGQFNQECRGWVLDTIECTFNYEKYGFPEVDEVFVFIVNESMKDELCGDQTPPIQPLQGNGTIE
jgi:hypothetical protein